MSRVHSKARTKPSKPYPDFPLFPHATGRWAKKIRGSFVYFGPWDDPDTALEKYLAQKDALHAGRLPRADVDAATVKDAANAFLNHKQALLDNGELSPHTWTNYRRATEELVKHLGKTRLVADLDSQDFAGLRKKMAKKWGPHRLAVTIQHVRSVFKHAFEAGLIATPLRFGPGFQRPTKKTFRLHRAAQGLKLFEPAELRRIIDAAGVPLKAMVLLGINCGMGNSDCGNLPFAALDLEKGWLDYSIGQGYTVIGEHEDKELSGGRADNRPGLQEAITAACDGQAVLVVFSLSRLARCTKDAIDLAERLNSAGADLAVIQESVNTRSPMGRFIFTLFSALAQLEREQIADRTSNAMLRHQANGRRMTRGDRCPFGWRPDAISPDQIVQDVEEQSIIGRIRDEYERGRGMREIARYLDGAGIACRGRQWSHSTIRSILKRKGAGTRQGQT